MCVVTTYCVCGNDLLCVVTLDNHATSVLIGGALHNLTHQLQATFDMVFMCPVLHNRAKKKNIQDFFTNFFLSVSITAL